MPEFWGMGSTPSLPSLSLWPGVVAPDKGEIELICTYTKLNCFKYKWLYE